MTTTTIDTTKTLLVGIEMGLPRQSRQLPKVSEQVEAEAKADAGTTRASVHYWKWNDVEIKTATKGANKGKARKIIQKHDGLEPLRKFQSQYKADIMHYARFPYAAGALMLPAALAVPCLQVRDKYEKMMPEVWKHWVYEDYPKLLEKAPARMGEFYDPNDFPTVDECIETFRCEVSVIPLASADQWQLIAAVAPDIAALEQQRTDAAYQKGAKEAHAKLWQQVMEPIEHAVATLSKDGSKIFDTLVGNIISIVDLLPAYNTVLKDPKLEQLANEAKAAFGSIKPDDLRKSNEAKAKMLESAKSIVNTFKPFQRKLAV